MKAFGCRFGVPEATDPLALNCLPYVTEKSRKIVKNPVQNFALLTQPGSKQMQNHAINEVERKSMNQLDKDDFLKNLDSKFDTFLRDTRIAIASHIRDSIKRNKITHFDAAELTGFGRTVITAVCNGRIDKISTDRLLKICTRLGIDIQVRVGSPRPQKHQYQDRIAS